MGLLTKSFHAGLYLGFSALLVACGGEGNEHGGAATPIALSSNSSLAALAGSATVSGSADGTATAAGFNAPAGVATDTSGNIFVVDSINQTVRKVTPAGVATTLAGTVGVAGSTDASGTAASFNFNTQSAIAADGSGNVYVSDTNNHTIRKIMPDGTVTTLAGTNGVAGQADGNGTSTSFNLPTGLATDSAGNVYVADSNNTVRKINTAGDVTTLAGTAGVAGSLDGIGAAASFNAPSGIATDSAGNIYVADSANNTIRKITATGTVTTLAGTAGVSGNVNSTGTAASFNGPTSVATDFAGNVYVSDTNNSTIRKILSTGAVTTVVGTAGVNSFTAGALPGALLTPRGISISGTSLYIASGNAVAIVSNVP